MLWPPLRRRRALALIELFGHRQRRVGLVPSVAAFTKGLAESAQQNRRSILEQFRNDHGDKRIALIHSVALQNIINKKTPAAQRNFRKAMRGFIKHCISLRLMKVDPLGGTELVKMKSKGHHPWETAECEQFEAFYPIGTRARLAYELLLQAGQSRCDVVRMGRQHPTRPDVDASAKDRRAAQCHDHAAATGSDRRDAGERSPDLSGDCAGQAIHGRGLWELVP